MLSAGPGSARWVRTFGITFISFFLIVGVVQAVTIISADIDTEGNLIVDGNATLGNAAADLLTFSGTIAGGSPFIFEGTTADDFETTFTITDPTADRTVTFQNASGTVAFLTDALSPTLTDNVTNAVDIQEGTNNYVNINTTNAAENISLGNTTTNPTFSFLGSGTTTHSGGIVLSGVTTDITAASGEDLVLMGGATSGSVVIQSNDELTDIRRASGATVGRINTTSGLFQLRGDPNVGNAGIVEPASAGNGYGVMIGNANDISASIPVLLVADNRDVSNINIFSVGGGGFYTVALHQDVACASGVLALDPTSSVIDLDPAGAACVVTLAETTAGGAFNVPGMEVTINIVGSAGGGAVTFPDVANIHNGPTLCTDTGLTENGLYTIMYVDKTNDLWLGKSCIQN